MGKKLKKLSDTSGEARRGGSKFSFSSVFSSFHGKGLGVFIVLGEGAYGEKEVEKEEKQEQSFRGNRKGPRVRTRMGVYVWRQEKIDRSGRKKNFSPLCLLMPVFVWICLVACGIFCLWISVSCLLVCCVISLSKN